MLDVSLYGCSQDSRDSSLYPVSGYVINGRLILISAGVIPDHVQSVTITIPSSATGYFYGDYNDLGGSIITHYQMYYVYMVSGGDLISMQANETDLFSHGTAADANPITTSYYIAPGTRMREQVYRINAYTFGASIFKFRIWYKGDA